LKGTATAIVFPQSALAKAVAYKSLAIYGGEPVLFKNLDSLTLRPTEEALPSSEAEFTFTLTGEATLVWQVDPAKISGAVAGKKRDSAEAILSAFPEVDGSVMTLRPFWADTFPADPQKVKVIVKTP
jgi:hypothetical protein